MERPVVISILALNNLPLTKQCLESIFENTTVPYRVCVVNQASTDGTRRYLDGLADRIDAIHSPKNLGFIGGNNLVMDRYRDCDIILLNNDTLVTKGWLRALRDCAYSEGSIGIVGAKLLYPDGRLQEAGCEIFQDGSGRNIGKNDDPERHIYNVLRDVDYCSGACLYIKRQVLDDIGYLDEIFSPAYWEDTDLCFRARKAGYRVVYEPLAGVVHLEGATSGLPEQNSLSKTLQARNKPKFMERWSEVLRGHRKNVFEIRTSGHRDKILVILPFLPMYDKAAGEKRWFHTLKILAKHFDIVFLARNGSDQLKYINELERMGITVFHTDETRLKQLGCDLKGPLWIDFPLLLRSNDFKAVIVGFYHMAHQYCKDIRTHSPDSVFIIDSYDLCFVRERRKADLSGDPAEIWRAIEVKRNELSMYRKADMVLTVTEEDRRRLLQELPEIEVGISTDIHPLADPPRGGRGRDIVFVGNYRHDPNEDAVLYFAKEIFPKIKACLPDVRLSVVGNAPTESIMALAGSDVVVTGFVPEVTPYLMESRVFVVPLRYGAGLKGKIGEALAAGIPIVTTSIGAEGMDLVHGKNALIADDPEGFAQCVIDAYRDHELWDNLSREGRLLAERNYSYQAVEQHWLRVIEFITRGRKHGRSVSEVKTDGFTRPPSLPEIVPDVGIVIPVHNNLALTRNCWTSIRKNTGIPHQVVIVDNGSDEAVQDEADQNNLMVIRNDANKGFAWACNQGIRSTYGDFVVILNNDTIVTPGWLERTLWHMQQDPTVGIVGPATNYANSIQQIDVPYTSERGLYDFSEDLYLRNRHQSLPAKKIVGVCMLLRRAMLEEIGLFDQRFGLGNFEDDDLCLRARIAGYKILWAKDAFVHHAGSKTFRIVNADYEQLLEENRLKYVSKWKPVVEEFGRVGLRATPEEGEETPASPVVVICDSGGESETVEGLKAAGQADGIILIKGGDEQEDQPGATIAQTIMDTVERLDTGTVFFLSAGTIATSGWTEPLEAALSQEGVGCALSSSNVGWGEQVVTAEYRKTGKPLVKFARRVAREWQGRVIDIESGFPSAVAVRRDTLLQTGLAAEFRTFALLLELQRRIADRGLRIVCAKASYVHSTARVTGEAQREQQAVLRLLDARRSLAEARMDQAISHIDKALEAKPDYAEALYERGVMHAMAGREREAMLDFQNASCLVPSDSRTHNNMGCLHFNGKRLDEAEASFKKAIEVDSSNWEAKRNLADLYMFTGRVDQATGLYSSIIQEHSGCPDVYVAVGEVFAGHGDLDTAERLYEMALRVSPDHSAARKRLDIVSLAKQGTPGIGGEAIDRG